MPVTIPDAPSPGRGALAGALDDLSHDWDHRFEPRPDGGILVVRVPADEPDAVSHMERVAEEVPSWLAGRFARVVLVGRRRSVAVPGYVLNPLLQAREAADMEQAANLRARFHLAYEALTYRSKGDPLALLRIAVRIPKNSVAALDDQDLAGIAYAAGPSIDDGRHTRVEAVLLISETDHVRIRPAEFWADVQPRWKGRRGRPRAHRIEPAAAPTHRAEHGFPSPPQTIQHVGPHRRRVEDVAPVLELEAAVDAVSQSDPHAMQLGIDVATKLLRIRGFAVRTGVFRGATEYAVAAERSSPHPRRVVVRVLPNLDRTGVDRLVVEARAMGADVMIALVADPDPRAVARASATRVHVCRPQDVAALAF